MGASTLDPVGIFEFSFITRRRATFWILLIFKISSSRYVFLANPDIPCFLRRCELDANIEGKVNMKVYDETCTHETIDEWEVKL